MTVEMDSMGILIIRPETENESHALLNWVKGQMRYTKTPDLGNIVVFISTETKLPGE